MVRLVCYGIKIYCTYQYHPFFVLYIRHVAFHGTTKDVIPSIFKAGLHLLKPGDHTITGVQLGTRGGHITKPFKRYNKYSKEEETFDPNQIFVSPSIKLNIS